MLSNGAGETCGIEECIETEGLREPSNLSEIEDDRFSSDIDAEIATIHVRLGEDKRLIGNIDVWYVFGPPRPSLLNSLDKMNYYKQRGSDAHGPC